MGTKSFRDLEHEGWVERAGWYHDLFGRVTSQAIGPVLDALGELEDTDLLDIACGSGELAAAAGKRGARVQGVDFAVAMVEAARARYPEVRFREGDAEDLPYPDSSFDRVVCSFGVLHLANPERAFASARRVLRPGGTYAMTTWFGPDRGGELYDLVMGAVRTHGTLEVDLPAAQPIFRFSDPDECRRCLSVAGLEVRDARTLNICWTGTDPRALLEMIHKSMVRSALLLQLQQSQARLRIEQAIVDGAEARRRGDRIELRIPALLVVATAA
jgi:SAM-dependent methyltransferase